MINLPKQKCYGCMGCVNVCPKDAIFMKEDSCGFRYPKVNYEKCINCGLCIKVCPELHPVLFNAPRKIYAARTKQIETLKTSASGGVAAILASHIINQGGVVYGCCETNYLSIGHIRISSIDDLYLIQNSKYVHSDIRETFREAKTDLIAHKTVLFTGTPCQIAGLKGFLRKEYENLFTMDIVCHGVPPMKLLEEQILSYPIIREIPPEEIKVEFRWKSEEKTDSDCLIHFGLRVLHKKNDKVKVLINENDLINPYMRCFQTGVSLRENCLHCPFAKKERVSDITAADFWGLGRIIPSNMTDFQGVSLVLINTEKGGTLFDLISNGLQYEEHTFEEAQIMNRCLNFPFRYPKRRKRFLTLCAKKGLIVAAGRIDPIHKMERLSISKLARHTKLGNLILRMISKILRLSGIGIV